jgi:rhodanese-related sulfurtransferase
MKKRKWVSLLLVGLLVLMAIMALATMIGIAESKRAGHISQQALLTAITSNNPAARPQLLDVRSDWEYQSGHIPTAKHVPFWAVSQHKAAHFSSEQPVIVYCELGPRAGFAGLWLRAMGYKNIVYLDGHMAAWREAALPLETRQ